jgi:hypothetical protein
MPRPTANTVGTELQQAINAANMLPVSVHLGKLSDIALQQLHDALVYQFDAHRTTTYALNESLTRPRPSRRVDPELREYFQAVKLELLTRTSAPPRFAGEERYKTVPRVDVLKRAIDARATQGTVSLGDLQAEYRRLRR